MPASDPPSFATRSLRGAPLARPVRLPSGTTAVSLPPRGALYLHDGSVEGLLCTVAEARRRRELPASVACAEGQLALGDALVIARNDELAERTLREFGERAGPDALHRTLLVLLSEETTLDAALATYLLLGFHLGPGVTGFHSHPAVHAVQGLAQKVAREIHRFKGILRFRELATGLFWAPIEPDYNIAWALARHFSRRLPTRHWMIHDMGRDTGVLWDGDRLERVDVVSPLLREPPSLPDGLLSDREAQTQDLWREYFRGIANPTRRNPRQQRRCLPHRYWKWLVEEPSQP